MQYITKVSDDLKGCGMKLCMFHKVVNINNKVGAKNTLYNHHFAFLSFSFFFPREKLHNDAIKCQFPN